MLVPSQRRLAAAERPGRLPRLHLRRSRRRRAARSLLVPAGSEPPRRAARSHCTSLSSRPPGSPRAARSSISRAAPAAPRPHAAVAVNEIFAKVSEYRDLVLVDQRGTGGSDALRCPQEHVQATDAGAVTAYLRRCFARLGGQARLLTSAAAADDLERVRRALGYGRIDVYGSSYGATLAQLYLRRYPQVGAHADARRRLAAERARLRARGAQRRARAARAEIARCQAAAALPRAPSRDTRAELARVLAQRPPAEADRPGDRRSPCCCARPRTPRACRCVVHAAAAGDRRAARRASTPRTWAASSTLARASRWSG